MKRTQLLKHNKGRSEYKKKITQKRNLMDRTYVTIRMEDREEHGYTIRKLTGKTL